MVTKVRYLIKLVNGVPVVRAPDEIDNAIVDQLHAVLLHATSRGHATAVVDMTGTRFCDSAGLHALLRAHRRAQADGGELRVAIADGGPVRRLCELICLESLMPVFASVQEAVDSAQAVAGQRQSTSGPDAGQRQASG